jgi:hypothetical protein
MTKHDKSQSSKEKTELHTNPAFGPNNRAVPGFGKRVQPTEGAVGWSPKSPPKQSTKDLSTFAPGGSFDSAGKPLPKGAARDTLRGGSPVSGGKETSSERPNSWATERKG